VNLGVVGHAAEKFTRCTEAQAVQAIFEACDRYKPERIVSGHSPMGGVDIWAEDVAADLGIPTIIHAPKVNTWGAPGGFKDRNLAIARDSDLVLCIVVSELPPGFAGRTFGPCYHCKGRNPWHVKSGGCWTAWKCDMRSWVIL
jgi:hypothetical protein